MMTQSITNIQQPKRLVVLAGGNDDGPIGFFKRLGKGLDDMVDDAMMKKLGNGHSFYGKRKSNFYGSDDKNKMKGAWEDYSGPQGGSYFKLDSEGRPISRRGTLLPTRNVPYPDDVE
mmetsp:Transcript_23399/g.29172  ORF Transcript_23399/g.29172 Transcript_23399/m.29172 type:complete len:117 (+) Transcript_23399:49-399(+)